MIDQAVQAAVLDNPLGGGLLPHSGDPGKVVTWISAQRREIRVLGRGEAVFLSNGFRRHACQIRHALAGVQHRGVAVDKLE